MKKYYGEMLFGGKLNPNVIRQMARPNDTLICVSEHAVYEITYAGVNDSENAIVDDENNMIRIDKLIACFVLRG